MNRLLLKMKRTFRGYVCLCGTWISYPFGRPSTKEPYPMECPTCGRTETYRNGVLERISH